MKNFIDSAQILKLFAWEKPFREGINNERRTEKSHLNAYDKIKGLLLAITLGGISLSVFSTMILDIYFGIELNTGESLLVISCLYTLQLFLPYVFVVGLS